MLTHNVELTTLIHKIIVSIVASAHELRLDHINVFQGVGATLLNSGILSRTNSIKASLEGRFIKARVHSTQHLFLYVLVMSGNPCLIVNTVNL